MNDDIDTQVKEITDDLQKWWLQKRVNGSHRFKLFILIITAVNWNI